MPGNTLNGEALHSYDFPGIFRFVLIREKIAILVFVISGIAFQRVLPVSIKRDDDISYISGAPALDDKQIVFLDTGIDHGITLCPKNIKLSFAKHRNGKADILFNIFLFFFRRAALNGAYKWGGNVGCLHFGTLGSGEDTSVVIEHTSFAQFLQIAVSRGSGHTDAFRDICYRRSHAILLVILVHELQYRIESSLIFSPHISTSIPKWDFISHYMQNKINCNRVRQVVSAVADTNFFIRKEMALINAISKQ